jgi:hypothetical protein
VPHCSSGEEDISIKALIDAQRRFSVSRNSFERIVGSLCMAGLLKKELSMLPDKAIGQLLFNFVLDELNLLSPETMICQVATERLINSSSVVKIAKENVSQ